MEEFLPGLSDQEQQRYEKRARLRERGIDPYPLRAERTHTARAAIEAFERGETLEDIQLAGRLISLRDMGKLCFAHLQDGTAKIQLMFRRDVVGADRYTMLVKEFDLGDFISARGKVLRTRTGEITLEVSRFELLTKTLAPLPEKWHGLKDIETRYRQRYLDLLASEDVRRTFLVRSRVVSAMQATFRFCEPGISKHDIVDRLHQKVERPRTECASAESYVSVVRDEEKTPRVFRGDEGEEVSQVSCRCPLPCHDPHAVS